MFKLMGISKRGKQQIQRHGDIWVRVKNGKPPCLDGALGLQLRSIRDGALFWIRVEDDPNIAILGGKS